MSVWCFVPAKNINLCMCHDPAVRIESICDKNILASLKAAYENQ